MKVVKKKILPEYFRAVRAKDKNFEIRKDEDDIEFADMSNMYCGMPRNMD